MTFGTKYDITCNEEASSHIMLTLRTYISKGATRIIFEHPSSPDKCVKVALLHKNRTLLQRELDTYLLVKPTLKKLIPDYEDKLVETNAGPGLVCELLKDDNGTWSKSLNFYKHAGPLPPAVIKQLYLFAATISKHNLFFYDFNPMNFVVQIKDGKHRLYYTDLKSYRNFKPWIYMRLERVFTCFARHAMLRRLQKMFVDLRLEVPKGS